MLTYRIEIRGKVQGVGFRQAAQEYARAHDICGTVRNSTVSLCVEILCTGDVSVLKDFLAWCSHGPRYARVDVVSVYPYITQRFDDFLIIT